MAVTEEKLSKEQIIQKKISDFTVKNKKSILAVLVLVAVLVIAIVVSVTSISNSREKALIKVAALQDSYEALDKSSETYSQDFADLVNECKSLVGGKRYPSVKAQYLIGLAYFKNNNFDIAYDAFMKAYELNKNIYLSELALFNAAAALESDGKTDDALNLYEKVITDYSNTESAVVPKALFSAARIYQEKGDLSLEKTTLEQLSAYTNSEYGKLAQNILNVL